MESTPAPRVGLARGASRALSRGSATQQRTCRHYANASALRDKAVVAKGQLQCVCQRWGQKVWKLWRACIRCLVLEHSTALILPGRRVTDGPARVSPRQEDDGYRQGQRARETGQASGHTNPCAAPWPSCRARRSSFRSGVWPWIPAPRASVPGTRLRE